MSHNIESIFSWLFAVFIIGFMLEIMQVGYYFIQFQSYQKEVGQIVQRRGGMTDKAVTEANNLSKNFYGSRYATAPLKDYFIEYQNGSIKFYDKSGNYVPDSKMASYKDARVLYSSQNKSSMLTNDSDFNRYSDWDAIEKLYVKSGDNYVQLSTPDLVARYLPYYYEARYGIGNNLIQLADYKAGGWNESDASKDQIAEIKNAFNLSSLSDANKVLNTKLNLNSISHDNGYQVNYQIGMAIIPVFAFSKSYQVKRQGVITSEISQNLPDDLLNYGRDWDSVSGAYYIVRRRFIT